MLSDLRAYLTLWKVLGLYYHPHIVLTVGLCTVVAGVRQERRDSILCEYEHLRITHTDRCFFPCKVGVRFNFPMLFFASTAVVFPAVCHFVVRGQPETPSEKSTILNMSRSVSDLHLYLPDV